MGMEFLLWLLRSSDTWLLPFSGAFFYALQLGLFVLFCFI
jgi:hypothetical protein